jgi:hypothetical protein
LLIKGYVFADGAGVAIAKRWWMDTNLVSSSGVVE